LPILLSIVFNLSPQCFRGVLQQQDAITDAACSMLMHGAGLHYVILKDCATGVGRLRSAVLGNLRIMTWTSCNMEREYQLGEAI
jgi:hypothetical protein